MCIRDRIISNNNVRIGNGSFIGPNTIINNGSVIGDASIINSGAIVEHDNIYGNAIHLASGVKTGGRVRIGDYSFIGVGSSILPDIKIGSGVLIGAGSTLTKNVKDQITMIGYSARQGLFSCLLYTSPSPRDVEESRMPSSA